MNNKIQNKIYNNDNIFVNKTGYCSKCLRELDMSDSDVVKDMEGNLFCDSSCRGEYWREVRLELDTCFREWARKG